MKKTQLTTRTAWLLALVVLLVVCLTLTASLSTPKQAQAYATDPSATVGEIYNESADSFNQVELQKLLNALGGSGTTVANLQSNVNGSSTIIGATDNTKTYDKTMQIAEKNIIVEFGGIKWIAVFLSLADTNLTNDGNSKKYETVFNKTTAPTDGDVVLTLWQASGTEKVSWSDVSGNFGTSNANTKFDYPANMYGASKIRAVTLNNGGSYTTNGTNLVSATQSSTNIYAKFNQTGDIKNYLVAPRYVGWQKDLKIPSNWTWAQKGKSHNNDAWGWQGSGEFYQTTTYWYEENTYYRQWMDDLIWLPATAETGHTNPGVWGTTDDQLKSSDTVWLRTASLDYYTTHVLTADGVPYYRATAESHLVRPALHLNLTAAAKDADTSVDKPTVQQSKTVTYSEQQQSLDLGVVGTYTSLLDGTIKNNVDVTITSNNNNDGKVETVGGNQTLTATKAGTYKVTVKPATGFRWINSSNANDTSEITFTLTITPAPITISPTSISGTYNGQTHDTDVTFAGLQSDSLTKGVDYTVGFNKTPQNAGDYTVTVTLNDTETTNNYVLIGSNSFTYTVKPKNITLSISNATHVYGSNVATLGIDNSDAWVNSGDQEELLSAIQSLFVLKKQISPYDQVTLNSALPVGKYNITVANGTYGNYEVTFVSGVYSVTKAKLTVTANDAEISYGDTAKNNGVKYDGFVNGEDQSVLDGSLTFTYGTYVVKSSGIGTYDIAPGGYTSNNYDIEFKNGKLTVNPRAITVKISNATHVYGSAVSAYAIGDPNGGWVNPEDKQILFDAITFVLKTQTPPYDQVQLTSTLAVGKYNITAESKTYGNYEVTFVNGVYEVTEAEIGVTGNFTQQHTYGFTDGSATQYKMEISLAALTLQGEQQATITYSNFTCSRTNAQAGVDYLFEGGIYTVFKAGTYTVEATISAPNHKTAKQKITITILKVKADVTASCETPEKVYTDGDLPTLGYTAFVGKQAVTGTIRWTKTLGSVNKSGWTLFGWRWICDDDSVEDATGEQGFTVEVVEVRKINVVFNAGDKVFYETNALSELTQYLTVTAIFTNEKQKELASNEYVLTCQGGSVLVAGKGVAIIVTYTNGGKTVTESFTLDVEVLEVSKITVEFNAGDRTFNENDPLSELTKYLIVTAYFNNGTQKVLANNEYTLTCNGGNLLVVGENIVITVSYTNRGKTVTDTFTVDVAEAEKPPIDDPIDPPDDPDDPTPPTGDDPENPDNNNPDNTDPEPKQSLMDKIIEWFDTHPLPLGIASVVLGSELLLIIILAIAARKPKNKK